MNYYSGSIILEEAAEINGTQIKDSLFSFKSFKSYLIWNRDLWISNISRLRLSASFISSGLIPTYLSSNFFLFVHLHTYAPPHRYVSFQNHSVAILQEHYILNVLKSRWHFLRPHYFPTTTLKTSSILFCLNSQQPKETGNILR